LVIIFLFLLLGFNLRVHLSKTDTKLQELTQQLAIEQFERYCNDHEKSSDNPRDQIDLFGNDKA
ncbi:MAG: hypothetical protein ACLTW2_00695, partial [Eggerthellaceae bacterium]